MSDLRALSITTEDRVMLSGESSGEGAAIVLLHGLTATRRYVVMGSRTLQRSGHRVLAYDARGHGRSAAATDRRYGYERLAADLREVLQASAIERAIVAGASMGAHTAVRFALEHPDRVAALALITPAYEPSAHASSDFARWDALAEGLRTAGVEGFLRAYELSAVPPAWRATVEQVLRQRLSAHEHPEAVADALEVVPRSRPFEDLRQLGEIRAPTVVIASRDEADPEHPLAVGERYAHEIADAQLLVEDAGPPQRSPIAWQGGQLSRVLVELSSRIRT
jgi:3-oxoadipate enol-lactonase